ncbi:hypothetical protein FSP39_010475 [Pinctada imbricata]|uniref:Protein kinase domain-containing protein n=1 Tax=Pinctada imbricata TaxID=66713 RepID=A0AA88XV30_PINIB|nr:hypothetical protein FSP39_010475 [Pinctada imbricata]
MANITDAGNKPIGSRCVLVEPFSIHLTLTSVFMVAFFCLLHARYFPSDYVNMRLIYTSNTDVLLNQGKLSRVHEFWLLAISRDSAVADVKFNMTSLPFSDVVDIKKDEYKLRNWPIHVEVSIVRDIQNGTIMALAEWDHPNKVAMPQSDAYSIHLFLEDCEAYDDSPPCDVPPQLFTDTLFHSKEKRLSFSIPNLMFNALYRVRVELDSDWYGEAEFYTDFCVNVDWRTYTTCSDVAPYDRVASPRPHPNQKTPLPYNPLLYTVNMLSCHYDANSNRVVVSFNWTVPFNKSYVDVYLVKALDLNMSAAFDTTVDRTNSPNYTFTLYPYREYVISVEAKYRTDNGSRLSRNSELLLFNTSWITNMPVKSSLDDKGGDLKSSFLIKEESKNYTSAVWVAGASVLSILIGLAALFVYKKRHSFKAIIIPKTTVAKSNSYKSNVGCKVDYSNQLLVMSDEWELDTRLLKFSSPIGQGAFGKVVTGYYSNKKVAIKLVRDSAPLSYKEDLLAEINLMKRLGSHPNIVSLMGACTLSEPIALVMEYVPYGNLQTFLKKCRLEGEFQRHLGRPNEVTYSLMDSSGGIDSGVITPADMLSFTRQVAMAMEYLSVKKYVHRDLAARNVLLGYDKIVKICDFGLSRDIYNDNQYHKITSGKLPLKWMAVESLRDRIFTTQSDVWSFGILMWEIITMGGSPYPNIALADLYYVLANGYRMEKPTNCSDELYLVMRQCWMEDPSDRPSFTDLRVRIELLLSRDRDYLELENIDVPFSPTESSSSPKSEDSDTLSLISTGSSQQKLTIVPPPIQQTSKNGRKKAKVTSGDVSGATGYSYKNKTQSTESNTPFNMASMQKSSKERLLRRSEDDDQ